MDNKTKSNNRLLDKFYTKKEFVPALILEVKTLLKSEEIKNQKWLEPSAGNGSFAQFMPKNSIFIDIEPHAKNIKKGNFLEFKPNEKGNWVVIGNPPFGKNSSMAIKFFNHAAKFATIIAFIVPKTFEKDSVLNKLDNKFTLRKQLELPNNAFTFEGNDIHIPCVFQIWVRSPQGMIRNKIIKPKTHIDFEIVKDKSKADFAFQRVGAKAGKIKDMSEKSISAPSHHYIRVTNRKNISKVREVMESIDFSSVKYRTAGNPSISLGELVELYVKNKNF